MLDAAKFRPWMTLGYEAAIVVSSERARPAVSTSHSGAVAVLGAIAEGAALCLVSAGDQEERVQRAPGWRWQLPVAGGRRIGTGPTVAIRRRHAGPCRMRPGVRPGAGALGLD